MRRFSLVTTFLVICLVSQRGIFAQETRSRSPALSANVAPPFGNLSSAFELLHTRYRFENDGTGSKEVIARIRIFNKKGVWQWSELTFDYKPFIEGLEIPYVRVVKKDGSVVSLSTAEVVERSDVRGEVPKFDYDEKHIAVRGVSPGDALEYEAVTVIRRPLAPGQFWAQHNFQSNAVMDEQLEIDIPSGRAVKVKTKPDIDAWETRDSKRGIYHWKSLNPTLKYRQSTTDPWHETADVQLSSFGSWEEVGRWYARLEENRRIPTTEVRAKADELTKGLHSDLEKAEALYEFVAKKIKYLSLMSLGVGGYVPSSANEVLRKGNGDCKDKVTLLAALLEAKGMYASSVLINPNRELEPEVPSPWPFTHVITMLPLGDEKIWMDPSSALLPFRTLSPQLRKKQGLVMPPGGAPYFEETPQDAPVSKSWLEKLDGRVGQNGVLNNAQGFQVLLGNGDGTFEAPVDTNLVTPLTFAVGDFDGDGKTDVVVTTTANTQVQISLYLSNGDGTFRLGQQYAQVYRGVNVADVNKDGKEDLVIIGFAQPLLVMLGNGDGTFQKAISGPTAFYSGEAVIRDFNGDGKPDIVVGTYDGIAFLKGNGNGTFEAPVYSNPTLQFCCQASAGDFNGDGRLDVVSNLYNTVLVIPGNGDGTFQSPTAYSQNGQLYSGNIVVGDFNYDGVSDVGLVINDQTTGATEASLYLSEPAVHLFPSSVNFGSEKVGNTSLPSTIYLRNMGNAKLSIIDIILTGTSFLEKTTCGKTLAIGGLCTVQVSFKPIVKGIQYGKVTISGSATPNPQQIFLQGTGQ